MEKQMHVFFLCLGNLYTHQRGRRKQERPHQGHPEAGHPGGSVLRYFHFLSLMQYFGLPWWFSGKESTCSEGDSGSVPGLERSPGGGNSNPLQYSCLENPMDREAWTATVHGVAKSWTRLKRLSMHTPAILKNLPLRSSASL